VTLSRAFSKNYMYVYNSNALLVRFYCFAICE
jgi:hypothetical protein